MQISAQVHNSAGHHAVHVATAGTRQPLPVAGKPGGGSSVNGGEFLMLALATCYCNDLYREAARLRIELTEVEVEASAWFDGIGLAARDVCYRARITSTASASQVEQLLRETDVVAEVQTTLRAGVAVRREPWAARA
ncbi:OsmC family protein [Roseateles cellulosilyticus]|uniref:OsmC family protein n=1 Tax=Pelomonas cellulosilytica TaxID=2906762 RepID=A0ABS8XLE5_9BURK|nr:OsmC family protein [Pelomonas sp. P8]MCE4553631.1 OsmC family protein [Pelomonas sp. P8]